MKKLYPLKFRPALKYRVWGGGRLVKNYGKVLPEPDKDGNQLNPELIGESWELYNMENESSVVTEGFLADNDLDDILETYLGDLVGESVFDCYGTQFPLLIKMLDINERLSVQVHPNDEIAFERYDSLGKTEFWYVMEAEPDAVVYMGFKRDVTVEEFYRKCKEGTAEELLNAYHPQKGDCFLVEAGTVHAACGGIVIAEIQEQSDLTFRLYDWGREHNPATARQMHLEEAVDCIDYGKYNEAAYLKRGVTGECNIADCRHFTIDHLVVDAPREIVMDDYDSFVLLICTAGSAVLQGGESATSITTGETVLVPAMADDFTIVPDGTAEILKVYIRKPEEEKDSYINE